MRPWARRARARLLFTCGALWLAALAQGCARHEVRWLELEHAEPTLLEAGGTLRVDGSGFAAGQACEVRLTGRSFRPGLDPAAVNATFAGRALSDSAVAVPLEGAELARALGHGSFEGELEVAFAVRGGEGRLVGRMPARFDVSLPFARGAGHEQRLRERARALLEFAGIAVAEDESLLAGLVVRRARAGSAAEALGLRADDVIVRAGGVSVHALSDLAPTPGARSVSLAIRRKGAAGEIERVLSLQGLHAPDLSAELTRLAAALAFLLACAALLGPWPSAADVLARALSRVRHAAPAQLGLWGGSLRTRRAQSLRGRAAGALAALGLPVLASVLGAVFVWLEPAGFLAVRSISLYLGLCAVSVTLTLVSEAGTSAERLRAAADVVGRMAVMGVLIACACALAGTRAFDGMVVGQGAWPWRWALFEKPALLLAFPLYVVFASRLGATTLPLAESGRTAQLLVLERVLTNVVLCALGVAIFAGGWQSPHELFIDGIDPRLLGALGYVCKTWCFAWLLSAVRRSGLGDGLRRRAIAALCGATIALTALWLWLEPPVAVELAIGQATFASSAWIALLAVVRGLSPAGPSGTARVEPA